MHSPADEIRRPLHHSVAEHPRGHDDCRKHSLARHDELRNDDCLAVIGREQREPHVSIANILDLPEAANKNVSNMVRVYQPVRLFQIGLHVTLPLRRTPREGHRLSHDSAITFADLHRWDRAHAYRRVNA